MRVETACRFVSGAPNVNTGDHMGVAPTVVLGASCASDKPATQ